MSKEKIYPIVFMGEGDFDGKEFTLEFNRRTVSKTENAGLNVNEIDSKPMTMVYILWWGSFLMHQPQMTKEQTDKILDEQFGGISGLSEIRNDKGESLVERICKLYAVPFDTLKSEDKANPRKMAVKF